MHATPRFRNRVTERRRVVEQARAQQLRRILEEMRRIATREVDYAKRLFEDSHVANDDVAKP
jgi:hypothetical protein